MIKATVLLYLEAIGNGKVPLLLVLFHFEIENIEDQVLLMNLQERKWGLQ